MNELLKELGTSRSMQKKLGNISQQQIESLLKKYGGLGSIRQPSSELTAREQLRAKIREADQKRLGKSDQNHLRNKQLSKTEDGNTTQQPVLTDEEKAVKLKAKLQRLQKKHKTVSDEDYYKSLDAINTMKNKDLSNVDKTTLTTHENIVLLYNHQHRNDTEQQIELSLD